MQIFTITKQHIKLLRHFKVGWQNCETGAPEIDPKRPYGNSDVPVDIYEILTAKTVGRTDSKRGQLTAEERERYLKLHRETEVALQIVLSIGKFKVGKYEYEEYSTEWRKCP